MIEENNSVDVTNMEELDINSPALDSLFVLAEYRESEAEKIEYSNYSYWRSTLITFSKSISGVIAVIVMVTVVCFAFIQPYLPNQQSFSVSEYINDYSMWQSPPSAKHWFGTDDIGRDMWARVWEGTRISLTLAFLITATQMILGILLGALWGYIRALDRPLTELYNVIGNIPRTIMLILLTFILTPGYLTMFIAMTLTSWIFVAKGIRNLVFIIRDREYNLASRCLGTPVFRMIMKNLIPHLISIIILDFALTIPGIIAAEVTMTYMGIGLPLEVPSLGVLLNSGRTVFNFRPHLLAFPAIVISIVTVSFYIAGNVFSDASDPKNHT